MIPNEQLKVPCRERRDTPSSSAVQPEKGDDVEHIFLDLYMKESPLGLVRELVKELNIRKQRSILISFNLAVDKERKPRTGGWIYLV